MNSGTKLEVFHTTKTQGSALQILNTNIQFKHRLTLRLSDINNILLT